MNLHFFSAVRIISENCKNKKMDKTKETLTIQHPTRIVGCGDNTILRWINQGNLKAKAE